MHKVDLAVIGSGPGGYRAAVLGALRGLNVCIIEKHAWGGCCLNHGCVPKKDWYHTAQLLTAQQHFAGRGIQGHLHPDIEAAWQHQRTVVATVQKSYASYLDHLKVASWEAAASFIDAQTLALARDGESHQIKAENIIIATGAQAHIPEPFPTQATRVLTTDRLFTQPLPSGRRVALIGSGVVATEMAFILTALGCEVHWLARSRMLNRLNFSRPARDALHKQLSHHGVELRLTSGFDAVEANETGVQIKLAEGDSLEVDWVCLGTGRKPQTEALNLAAAGIDLDQQGFIWRNDRLQTTHPQCFAIGDVANPLMTANHALAEATLAIDNIISGDQKTLHPHKIPMVVYSALELARLGYDEDSAEDAGLEPAVGFAAFQTSPCALGQDDTEGFVRLLADLDSGALLGGEIVGGSAGELIHLLSLAPDADSALRWLAQGIYNHPARAEEILNATETLASKWGLEEVIFGS